MISPGEFAEKLRAVAAALRDGGLLAPTEAAMKIVEEVAKDKLGRYNPGWAPLSEHTIERGNPDGTPGMVTGEMWEETHSSAEVIPGVGAEGLVYNNTKKALWFEMGTINQPPRSFLYKSMLESMLDIDKVYSSFAEKMLEGIAE